MPGLVFGGLALILMLVVLRMLANTSPKLLARRLRSGGGIAALALGGIMVLTGRPGGGIPLIALGVGLLGWGTSLGGRSSGRASAASTVRTRFLEMRLDQATGAVSGTILAGTYAGRRIEQMSTPELQRLAAEVDAESLALLEAYFDRRGAGRTADAEADPDAGRHARSSGEMSQEEAYQVLGLQPSAGAEDVRRAHRALMMKLHPDQGGSTYLAARVNEAKEVLLRRHG